MNNGHLTVNEQTPGAFRLGDGRLARFVPGYWKGDEFVYVKGAKTGMVLKQKWVEGHHFWEGSIRHFDKAYKVLVEKKMVEWRDKYFR